MLTIVPRNPTALCNNWLPASTSVIVFSSLSLAAMPTPLALIFLIESAEPNSVEQLEAGLANILLNHPPQIPQAFPSSAPQNRPFFVLWKFSHRSLCLTFDDKFSQYFFSVPDDSVLVAGVFFLALNSHGARGFGSAQRPRFSALASSSREASRSSSLYFL